MLPSMPLLFICPQEQIIGESLGHGQRGNSSQEGLNVYNSFLVKGQTSFTEEGSSIIHPNCENDFQSLDDKDCDDGLLFIAEISSEKRKFLQGTGARKKRKIEYIPRPGALTTDTNYFDNHFAEAYFAKAKNTLSETIFMEFVCILGNFDPETGSIFDLHQGVVNLLKEYPFLSQEFIGFLLPHQALQCKQFTESLYFEKSWSFFQKADACHLNRIIQILEQLAFSPTTSLELVRNSVLPLLKGHPNLVDAFLQLLPQERPLLSTLMDYEEIRDYSGNDGNWERIRILLQPDRGCGNTCGCVCHSTSANTLCISCNIKFSNGHVYVQYGKVSRFARVQFSQVCSEEILSRLNPALYNKPRGKAKIVRTHKGSLSSSNECGSIDETDRTQPDMSGVDNDDVNDEDTLVKQESEDFGYFDLGDYNEDDVIMIEDEDDYCEDDDKVSETSSGEGDKSMDSGTGDFMFDELGCNEDDYDDDDDDDDDILKDVNFNDSSSETLDNKLEIPGEECNGKSISFDKVQSFNLLESDLNQLFVSKSILTTESDGEKKENEVKHDSPQTAEEIEGGNEFSLLKASIPDSVVDYLNEISIEQGNTADYVEKFTNVKLEENYTPDSSENLCSASLDLITDIAKDVDSIKFMDFDSVDHLSCSSFGNFSAIDFAGSQMSSNSLLNPENKLDLFEMKLLHEGCTPDMRSDNNDVLLLSATNMQCIQHELNQVCGEQTEAMDFSAESNNRETSGWTRAEDKVILEAFQKELDTEHTFSKISCIMPTRTVSEIQGRFQVLMQLLEKVASGTHDAYPLQ